MIQLDEFATNIFQRRIIITSFDAQINGFIFYYVKMVLIIRELF